MTTQSYPPPVDRLLTYGVCDPRDDFKYVEELGLTADHIPDLIRMAIDPELNQAVSESLEIWAPVHAWRSLGQLRAEAAIEPLLELTHDAGTDDDWLFTEIPNALGQIGAAALPGLAAQLANRVYHRRVRGLASEAIEKIGELHPEARSTCVAILTKELDRFKLNHPTLSGFLVASLLNLAAVESASSIEQAYAADRVDLSICGDWDEVQVDLGLKTRAEVPERRLTPAEIFKRQRHWLTEQDLGAQRGFGGSSSQAAKQTKKKQKKRK